LPAARRQFPRFIVLHLTAPRAVLSERLAARGRESGAEIRGRLERAEEPLPDDIGPVIEVSNDGPLEETVEKIRARLYPEKV
jgi:ribose 1,5-bisphosphokinase